MNRDRKFSETFYEAWGKKCGNISHAFNVWKQEYIF